MKKMQQTPDVQTRRSFLRQVAVAGGGAAVIAATGQANAMTVQPPSGKVDGGAVGYRMTDHISLYYRTARF